jgi:hypothetical protein
MSYHARSYRKISEVYGNLSKMQTAELIPRKLRSSIKPFHVKLPEGAVTDPHRQFPRVGHFAACEEPQLYAEEIRVGLGSLPLSKQEE